MYILVETYKMLSSLKYKYFYGICFMNLLQYLWQTDKIREINIFIYLNVNWNYLKKMPSISNQINEMNFSKTLIYVKKKIDE